MRQAAPTHLRQTGALAGLVAGGLSAIGYALHCTADSLPSGIAARSCCARSPVLSSGLGCCGGSLISFQDVSTSLESGKGPINFHSHGRPSLRDLRRPQSTSPITVRRSGVYDGQAEVRLVRGAAK